MSGLWEIISYRVPDIGGLREVCGKRFILLFTEIWAPTGLSKAPHGEPL